MLGKARTTGTWPGNGVGVVTIVVTQHVPVLVCVGVVEIVGMIVLVGEEGTGTESVMVPPSLKVLLLVIVVGQHVVVPASLDELEYTVVLGSVSVVEGLVVVVVVLLASFERNKLLRRSDNDTGIFTEAAACSTASPRNTSEETMMSTRRDGATKFVGRQGEGSKCTKPDTASEGCTSENMHDRCSPSSQRVSKQKSLGASEESHCGLFSPIREDLSRMRALKVIRLPLTDQMDSNIGVRRAHLTLGQETVRVIVYSVIIGLTEIKLTFWKFDWKTTDYLTMDLRATTAQRMRQEMLRQFTVERYDANGS